MFRFTLEKNSNIFKIENKKESHRLYTIAHKGKELSWPLQYRNFILRNFSSTKDFKLTF